MTSHHLLKTLMKSLSILPFIIAGNYLTGATPRNSPYSMSGRGLEARMSYRDARTGLDRASLRISLQIVKDPVR